MSAAASLSASAGASAPRVQAWLVDLDTLGGRLAREERRTPRLAPDEIARAHTIGDAGNRARWVAAHIALRLALERFSGTSYARQPYHIAPGGRPSLPQPAPSFSLSHAGALALILVAGVGPVGADVEEIVPRILSAPRRLGLEALAIELAGSAALPDHPHASPSGTLSFGDAVDMDAARFIQAWCRVEAFAKAEGCGVGRLLTRAGLLGAKRRADDGGRAVARAQRSPKPESRLRCWDVRLPGEHAGYAAAVAGPCAAAGLFSSLVPRPGSELLEPARAAP